jgi:hypothetical protein
LKALRCGTCGSPIDDVGMALFRTTERGPQPVRRGSFKIVHKGVCDTPPDAPGKRSQSWELGRFIEHPEQLGELVAGALLGTAYGDICLSDESLLMVISSIDPSYDIEGVRRQIQAVRC